MSVLTSPSPAGASDSELARQIQSAPAGRAREHEAELFRRFAPRLRLYAHRHLKGTGACDDLVQQTMETVLQKLRAGEVRDPERISSFILGCARLTAHSLRRKHQREEPVDARQLDTAGASSPPAQHRLSIGQLAKALNQLSERERTVIALSFYGEQSSGDIAEAIGTTAGNVRVIRSRAVSRLRSLMEPEDSHDA